MSNNNIALIGAGNLGSSVARGIVSAKLRKAEEITLTATSDKTLEPFISEGFKVSKDNAAAIGDAEIIILAVKPWLLLEILDQNKNLLLNKIVISLAAGIDLVSINNVIDGYKSLFRVMPNTAAAVNESITFIAGHSEVAEDLNLVESLFSGIGKTMVIKEDQMDAATVLGASGIAFAMRYIRASMNAGIEVGLKADISREVVLQMVKGAVSLLENNGSHPESEIDRVTTPGGCTIAGLNAMEESGFNGSVIKGVKAGVTRLKV